ncbi:TRAP transporter large permease [Marinobacter sp. M5B]|uniref:TRAP transporter large permease n=1 Tax=Marinobacter sp. M5B TaxID=3141535 RepID=UPI0036D37A69
MDALTIGFIGMIVLFVLLILRVPVGISLLAVGFGGITASTGFNAAMGTLTAETWHIASSYTLSVIPLFILMGNLTVISGLSRNLYDAAQAVVGHYRGGLASATILGCGGFAAVSGSSLASALTMGRVVLPQMERLGYNHRLSTGALAAGGTLGILIPPSTGFIIYGILSEQSIGRLFMAGILPGLLLMGLFIVAILGVTFIRPDYAPSQQAAPLRERLCAIREAAPLMIVAFITIGGIYAGAFTPVEAAGVGAFLVLLIALLRRKLSWRDLQSVLVETARTTAVFYLILIAAHVFSPFVALSGIPQALASQMMELGLGVYGTLAIILVAYVILGTFLEGFAMLVLTLPIVLPIIAQLGIDPIWFGVLVVIVLEMGLITPPVGMNVFAVKGIAPHIPLSQMYVGVLPFWFAMGLCLVIVVLFPQLALMIPDTMFGH